MYENSINRSVFIYENSINRSYHKSSTVVQADWFNQYKWQLSDDHHPILNSEFWRRFMTWVLRTTNGCYCINELSVVTYIDLELKSRTFVDKSVGCAFAAVRIVVNSGICMFWTPCLGISLFYFEYELGIRIRE